MGFIVSGIKSIGKAIGSVVKGVVGVVSKVVGGVFGFLVGGSKKTAKAANNLNKSLEPEAGRKIVFGRIAAPLDVRYWEVYGKDGSQFDEVLALATHRLHSVLELYLEQNLAINAAGVVQSRYVGVLSRDFRRGLPGQTALAAGSGSQWNAQSTFDGVAHMVLRWKPDEKKLPNGIPSRLTQVVEGAPVYDPRRDSTVIGGSGPHRINDRTTWDYAALDANGQPIGRNNALQALWYLLGWTIATKDAAGNITGEMLVAGRGVLPEDINLSTFIAGANACEAAGYYTDLILSTEEDHTANEDKITCDGLIGRLIDPGGLWSYYANVDDTANVAVELTDADILEGVSVSWNEYKGMADQFNQVGGKYVNGSAITLYQAFPYPLVRDATYEANLGVKRRKTQDFEQVLDYQLAQRLARLKLNEGQYQGEFNAGFMARALKAQAWSVVRYTSERFGWVKLFRVWRHDISTDGGVGMLLKEIHPSIWQAGTVNNAMTHGLGSSYNPAQEIALEGLAASQQTITGPGTNPTIADAARVTWTAPSANVRRTEIRYRVVGTTYWETVAPIQRGTATETLLFPLVRGAQYEIQARHISVHEVEGPWSSIAAFQAGSAGNISYAGIVAAGTTADVNNLTDGANGAVPRSNILTSLGISSGFSNQAPIATDQNAQANLNVLTAGAGSPLTVQSNVTLIGSGYRTATPTPNYGSIARGPAKEGAQYAALQINETAGVWTLVSLDTAPGCPNTYDGAKASKCYAEYFHQGGNLVVFSGGVAKLTTNIGSVSGDVEVLYDQVNFGVRVGGVLRVAFPAGNNNLILYPRFHAWNPNIIYGPARYGAYAIQPANNNIYDPVTGNFHPRTNIVTPEGISSGFLNQGGLSVLNHVSLGLNMRDSAGNVVTDATALNRFANGNSPGTNLFDNPNFDIDDGTGLRPKGVKTQASYGAVNQALHGWESGIAGGNLRIVGNETRAFFPMFRVNPNSYYRARVRLRCAGATLTNLHVIWVEYDADPPAGKTHITIVGGTPDATSVSATREISVPQQQTVGMAGQAVKNGAAGGLVYQQQLAASEGVVAYTIQKKPSTGNVKFMGVQITNYASNQGEVIVECIDIEEITSADETAANIASGILNQSPWATRVAATVSFATEVSNVPARLGASPQHGENYLAASVIAFTAGNTVEGLRPGEAGANVTEGRISSGFLGQKYLATQDFVDYDTRIGGLPMGLRPAQLRTNPDGNRFIAATSVAWSTTDGLSVESLRPLERGANITESRISNGFLGQKFLATQDFADFETRVTGAGKPASNAGTTLRLVTLVGSPIIQGNRIQFPGGAGKIQVRSANSRKGSARLEFRVPQGVHCHVHLSTTPGAADNDADIFGRGFGFMNGNFYTSYDGQFEMIGAHSGGHNDVWLIEYDGTTVTGSVNNYALTYSKAVPPNQVVYAKIYMFTASGLTAIDNIFFDAVTDLSRQRKLNALNGRPINNRDFQTANMNYSNRSRLETPTISYTANGNGWDANFSSGAIYPDTGPALILGAATHSALAASTTYHRYLFLPDPSSLEGASYGLASDSNGAMGTDKVYLGGFTTPAAYSAPPPPNEPPTYEECVASDAWVDTRDGWKQARYIVAGDIIRVLDEARTGTMWATVEDNWLAEVPCVKLTSKRGIELICSTDTPITLRNGDIEKAPNAWLFDIPTMLEGEGVVWESCKVEPIGNAEVAHIVCHQQVYAAGTEKGKCILTHNPLQFDRYDKR